MTTRVEAEDKSTIFEVENAVSSNETETGFHTLFVRDTPKGGDVWLQLRLFGITLPIPLAPFRNVVHVSEQSPSERIWTGNIYRNISYTPTQPR